MNDKTHNCECLACKEKGINFVCKTQNMMMYHLRRIHKQKMRINKNWGWTTKATTKTKKVEGKAKRKTTKKTKALPIITPKTEYIDIMAIIRVPIVVGQAHIIPAE